MPNLKQYVNAELTPGARIILDQRRDDLYNRTDLLFTTLIVLEWLAMIVVAVMVSPLAWEGRNSYLHPHIYVAVVLGGLVTAPVVYLYLTAPGKPITRHMIAFSQSLISALLIHLTGGRIETHFHIFGSLAFLAFYRDWRVFITAVSVIVLDHLVRGIYVPESVYGVLTASPWRTVEHAGWVFFESFFLIKVCKQNELEMKALAIQRDALQSTKNKIQELAEERAKELKKKESLLAAIVDNSYDAIIAIDREGLIKSWNAGASNLYGYARKEILGKNIKTLIPQNSLEEFDEIIESVYQGGVEKEIETLRLKNDNNIVDVALTVSPIKNEDQEFIGCSLIERDITHRKEVEKRISEFYSTVSHELRTPLTSIRGALSIIDDDIIELDSEEAREMIQVARTSSERLVRLINDILDLRKIEAGKLELHLEKMNTVDVIKQGIDTMQGMADKAGVKLATTCDGISDVLVDPDRMTQVISNLLSNAIKFSAPGDLVLLSVDQGENGQVRFSITDEGEGIAQDQIEKLFGKFQQIDSSDTRPKEGTGLGLAISKAIVEQHNGTIGVHSKPGTGSTFWFELPCQTKEAKVAIVESEQEEKCILIVEDDLNLAQLLKLCLKKRGIETRHATSLKQASELMKVMTPSAVILDVMLPDGNGLDFIEVQKANKLMEKTPVIVVSGLEEDEFEYAQPFSYDWYQKPFEFEELTAAIGNILNGKRHVLVIEDDDETRAVITAQLKRLNAICLEASDGKSAIEIARRNHPDVIVLDVNLPQMDGFEVVRELRGTPPPALLIYSGIDLDKEERERLKLGMTKHLTKGRVSPKQFVSTVEELLERVRDPDNKKKTQLNSGKSKKIKSNI